MALRSASGRRLIAELGPDVRPWVPEHFYVEATGVLRRLVLHEYLAEERAERARQRLGRMRITRVSVKSLLDEAWTLIHNVTIADAVYVVLARHLGAELVTLDTRLIGAPGMDVPIVTVPIR